MATIGSETEFRRVHETARALVSAPDLVTVTVEKLRAEPLSVPGVVLAVTTGDLLVQFTHPRRGRMSCWFARDLTPEASESAVYSLGALGVE